MADTKQKISKYVSVSDHVIFGTRIFETTGAEVESRCDFFETAEGNNAPIIGTSVNGTYAVKKYLTNLKQPNIFVQKNNAFKVHEMGIVVFDAGAVAGGSVSLATQPMSLERADSSGSIFLATLAMKGYLELLLNDTPVFERPMSAFLEAPISNGSGSFVAATNAVYGSSQPLFKKVVLNVPILIEPQTNFSVKANPFVIKGDANKLYAIQFWMRGKFQKPVVG